MISDCREILQYFGGDSKIETVRFSSDMRIWKIHSSLSVELSNLEIGFNR